MVDESTACLQAAELYTLKKAAISIADGRWVWRPTVDAAE
jgi:hypothetical protein